MDPSTSSGQAIMTPEAGAALTSELERFIFHEANLLDDRRYEEWLELLADDITYWIPNYAEDAPPGESGVIVFERLPALRARVARALDRMNPTQQPPARTRHFSTNVLVEPSGDELAVVTSSLLLYVSKDRRLLVYPGKCEHALRKVEGRWRIAAKTINLISNAEPLSSLPIV
jgi:3-phenylpropionate/cinnamic acid dioxygenase small subunit